jgi:hypothetical protein
MKSAARVSNRQSRMIANEYWVRQDRYASDRKALHPAGRKQAISRKNLPSAGSAALPSYHSLIFQYRFLAFLDQSALYQRARFYVIFRCRVKDTSRNLLRTLLWLHEFFIVVARSLFRACGALR